MVMHGYGAAYLVGLLLVVPVAFPGLLAIKYQIAKFSSYIFGVYLVHPLFIPIARRFGLAGDWLALPLTFGLSLGLVILIRRFAPVAGAKVT